MMEGGGEGWGKQQGASIKDGDGILFCEWSDRKVTGDGTEMLISREGGVLGIIA